MLLAAFQAYAWGVSARAAPHDVTLMPTADWSPPLGWVPWVTLAALGVLSVLVFTAGAVPPQRRLRPRCRNFCVTRDWRLPSCEDSSAPHHRAVIAALAVVVLGRSGVRRPSAVKPAR